VLAPCLSACPAGVQVPGFVALTAEGRYAEALKLHRERNPFAAICARVCFHTCEDHCRRTSLDGEAVAIRGIKRFMVDQEVTIVKPAARENAANAARKVAIVGAGPAGLTCAYFLARLGYKPTVYEAEPRPGGMLVQAIPAYRLPRETLAREIRMIESLGVEIKTLQRLGKDFTLQQLRDEGAEAVFLAVGAPDGLGLEMPGSDAKGIVDSMDFLRQYNIRGSAPVGKDVVVIGGGNAAIDAARTALRLGAARVTVVYRRTREQMPAYAEEIEEAQQEGVKLRTLCAPERFRGRKRPDRRLGLPADDAGRLRPQRAARGAGRKRRRAGNDSLRPGHFWRSASGWTRRRRWARWRRQPRAAGSRPTPSRARPRCRGCSRAATPSPARRRWSRPSRRASARRSASTRC
jgi:NADH-quinone oxidoreductase subunit F